MSVWTKLLGPSPNHLVHTFFVLCSHFIDILTKLALSNMDCYSPLIKSSNQRQTELNNKVEVQQKCITQAIEHKTEQESRSKDNKNKMTKIILLPLFVLATVLSGGSAQNCSGLDAQQCRGTDGCAWIGRCVLSSIWDPPSNVVLISTSIATATAYGHKNHNQSPSFPDDSSSILVGTNWQLSDINGAQAIRDEYEGLQGLSFTSEFELSGFDGCNQFSAEWSTVPSSSMITVHLGRRTRRGCGWMTEEQDMQMRDFMGVLIGQDAIAYSLSEDEQELTLYTDDAPTMTLTRIVDDELEGGGGVKEEEHMEDEPRLTYAEEYVSIGPSDRKSVNKMKNEGVVGAEYVSISSGTTRQNNDWIARCLQRCEDRYIICNERGWGNCGSRRDGCFDDCFNPLDPPFW